MKQKLLQCAFAEEISNYSLLFCSPVFYCTFQN